MMSMAMASSGAEYNDTQKRLFDSHAGREGADSVERARVRTEKYEPA
jgi:hypothetical protein